MPGQVLLFLVSLCPLYADYLTGAKERLEKASNIWETFSDYWPCDSSLLKPLTSQPVKVLVHFGTGGFSKAVGNWQILPKPRRPLHLLTFQSWDRGNENILPPSSTGFSLTATWLIIPHALWLNKNWLSQGVYHYGGTRKCYRMVGWYSKLGVLSILKLGGFGWNEYREFLTSEQFPTGAIPHHWIYSGYLSRITSYFCASLGPSTPISENGVYQRREKW